MVFLVNKNCGEGEMPPIGQILGPMSRTDGQTYEV